MDYTKKALLEYFKIHKTTLNHIIEYLHIQGTKQGNFIVFTDSDKEQIIQFLKKHPNTRVFFQQQTFLQKYGVKNPLQCSEIKAKVNQTLKNKYGVSNISQNNKIKQKKTQTLQAHYGQDITNPMDSLQIREAVKQNWANKSQAEKEYLLAKRNSEMLKRYGTLNPFQIENIKEKAIQTRQLNKTKQKNKLEQTYGKLWSITEICQSLSRCKDRVYDVVKELNINPIVIADALFLTDANYKIVKQYFDIADYKGSSNIENTLADYISTIYNGTILRNNKSVINPYELDIYLPDRNLAFEFDGIYYHSNLFKNKWYHFNKTKKCEQKGIRLIHVYEDDWILRTDIIKSMIKSALGLYDIKIYARKCSIQEIDSSTYKTFMNANHLQGFTKASYYLGLFYNNELVQCIGLFQNGFNKHWELNRMATKLNTQVVGGFSKLVKFGIKKYNITSLYSYVFKAWFTGNSYFESGFQFDCECPPAYWYIINGNKTNRINFKKSNIQKKVQQGELKYYNELETEQENMAHNGIFWIWDCGKIRLKYK